MITTKITESSPGLFRKDTLFVSDTIKGKKAIKIESLNNTSVSYMNMEFDADEDSLNRMSRYILIAQAKYAKDISSGVDPSEAYDDNFLLSVDWKLKNNTIANITIEQLVEVFDMSVANMTSIWLGQ